jgi:hypothetical protein
MISAESYSLRCLQDAWLDCHIAFPVSLFVLSTLFDLYILEQILVGIIKGKKPFEMTSMDICVASMPQYVSAMYVMGKGSGQIY